MHNLSKLHPKSSYQRQLLKARQVLVGCNIGNFLFLKDQNKNMFGTFRSNIDSEPNGDNLGRFNEIPIEEFIIEENEENRQGRVTLNFNSLSSRWNRRPDDESDYLVSDEDGSSASCKCTRKKSYIILFVIIIATVLGLLIYFTVCDWAGSCSSMRESETYCVHRKILFLLKHI